jgi:hypothetical protein
MTELIKEDLPSCLTRAITSTMISLCYTPLSLVPRLSLPYHSRLENCVLEMLDFELLPVKRHVLAMSSEHSLLVTKTSHRGRSRGTVMTKLFVFHAFL